MDPSIYFSECGCIFSGPRYTSHSLLPSLATANDDTTPKKHRRGKPVMKTEVFDGSYDLRGAIDLLARKLPREIQHKIFKLVAFPQETNQRLPLVSRIGSSVALAIRRPVAWKLSTSRPYGGATSRHQHKPGNFQTTTYGGEACYLNFLDQSTLRDVRLFAGVLEEYEGRIYDFNRSAGFVVRLDTSPLFIQRRKIGTLAEFMRWFWNEVVVDLRATEIRGASYGGKPLRIPLVKCPAGHKLHHAMISHVSLNLTIDLSQPSPGSRGWKAIQDFVSLCRSLRESCAHLKSVVLFFTTLKLVYGKLQKNPLTHIAWIRAFRKLYVTRQYEVKLLLKDLAQQLEDGDIFMTRLLKPACIIEEEFENCEGFGFEEFFYDEEGDDDCVLDCTPM